MLAIGALFFGFIMGMLSGIWMMASSAGASHG